MANTAPILTLDTNAQDIVRRFDRLPAAVQAGVLRGIQGALLDARTKFVQNPGVKARGAKAGIMSRLTTYARKDKYDEVDAAIGFRKSKHFPYELSQEFGAKAKAGGAMVVPLSDQAKSLSQRGIGPREGFAHLFVLRTGKGAFLASMGKKWSGPMVQYKLIKTLKARMRFRETMTAQIPVISEKIVNGAKDGWDKV